MIRSARPADVEEIRAIYAPIVEETIISFETEVPSTAELLARIRKSHEWLVYERDGTVVAYAYAAAFHPRAAYKWSVEVSIYVAPNARGSGLGKALLAELVARLSERGFVNVFAGIALPNPPSVALFEAFGFEKIAHQRKVGFKLGSWHDVGWWQLQCRDASVPPPDLELSPTKSTGLEDSAGQPFGIGK